MERNANYALVGFASMMLFVGLVIFVVWLARVQFSREYDTYDILFVGPVNGLSQGGEVHFNGIKVGDVTTIALDKDDPTKVVARVKVTTDVPIRADSYATLESQGITGVSYIQIAPGSPNKPLLKNMPHAGKYPVLGSRTSAMSNLLSSGGTVLASTVEALNRVNRVLSDENIKQFNGTIDDIHAITTEARQRKALFADADTAIKNIDTAGASTQSTAQNPGPASLCSAAVRDPMCASRMPDAEASARISAWTRWCFQTGSASANGNSGTSALPRATASSAYPAIRPDCE